MNMTYNFKTYNATKINQSDLINVIISGSTTITFVGLFVSFWGILFEDFSSK